MTSLYRVRLYNATEKDVFCWIDSQGNQVLSTTVPFIVDENDFSVLKSQYSSGEILTVLEEIND